MSITGAAENRLPIVFWNWENENWYSKFLRQPEIEGTRHQWEVTLKLCDTFTPKAFASSEASQDKIKKLNIIYS